MNLRLDWCSHAAAKYAVEHWHYSHTMPKSKLARIGVWEDDRFVGAVIYGVGAGNSTLGTRFGLKPRFEMAELVRVALTNHKCPTSRIVAISIKMIRKEFPGLKLLTSFADSEQGHQGIIYQASGWIYNGGREESNGGYIVNGVRVHPRVLHLRYGTGGQSIPWLHKHVDPEAVRLRTPVKHHYLYPLDEEMRARIAPLAKPYPKRAGSIAVDAPAIHAGEGGSTPTSALQDKEGSDAAPV